MREGWYHHWVSGVMLDDQLWHQTLVMDHVLELLHGFVIGASLWSASLVLAFNPNDHVSRYSVWFPLDSNPRPGFSASLGILGWSAGVWVSMGAGHVMAYVAIGLR